MAYVAKLSQSYKMPNGYVMDRILNLKGKVGPHADCANSASDVSAVQSLLALAATEYARNHHIALPTPTGTFDACTGFYLFEIQYRQKQKNPNVVVDGCATPSVALSYNGNAWYTIFQLNAAACKQNQAAWLALLHKHGTTPA